MQRWIMALVAGAGLVNGALAQDFVGSGSVGSNEPLYKYDDQEHWKHGWFQDMPYYGGFHAFRPYNYHHVFGQATTAQGWGMSMPYSQQFWHRYEHMTNLANPGGGVPLQPIPQQGYGPVPGYAYPGQSYPAPTYSQPGYTTPQPGYGVPYAPPAGQIPQPYGDPGQMQPIPQAQPMPVGPTGWNTPQPLPQINPQYSNVPTAYEQPVQTAQPVEFIGGPALPSVGR